MYSGNILKTSSPTVPFSLLNGIYIIFNAISALNVLNLL